MTLRKTWKVLPPAPADFHKQFPEYSKTVLNLLYRRVGKNKKAIASFFKPDFDQDLPDPFLFRDMEKAVGRILKAVKKHEKIAIYGDYDVDGITSTSVVKIILDKLGAEPEIYIPDRAREGYGVNMHALKFLKNQNI